MARKEAIQMLVVIAICLISQATAHRSGRRYSTWAKCSVENSQCGSPDLVCVGGWSWWNGDVGFCKGRECDPDTDPCQDSECVDGSCNLPEDADLYAILTDCSVDASMTNICPTSNSDSYTFECDVKLWNFEGLDQTESICLGYCQKKYNEDSTWGRWCQWFNGDDEGDEGECDSTTGANSTTTTTTTSQPFIP